MQKLIINKFSYKPVKTSIIYKKKRLYKIHLHRYIILKILKVSRERENLKNVENLKKFKLSWEIKIFLKF